MHKKHIVKSSIILTFSLLLNILCISKSSAQYSQIIDICNNENKRSSYGFSVEKCSEYLKEYEQSIQAKKVEYVKQLKNNVLYYVENDRHMIAVSYMKELLPFLEESGDIDTYNAFVDSINEVYNTCSQYANQLNRYNNNNVHNSVAGFFNTLQGQGSLSSNLSNFQNVMEYERERKQYQLYCSTEE